MKESKRATDNTSISRRSVLAGATLIPLAAIATVPQRAVAQAPATALTAEQRKTVDAFIDRMIPKDELAPAQSSAAQASRLTAAWRITSRPKTLFLEGLAKSGYFRLANPGIAFASLTPEKQDAVLMAIDKIRLLICAAFLSGSPAYARRHVQRSGLRRQQELRGWDLIRYPGAKLAAGLKTRA